MHVPPPLPNSFLLLLCGAVLVFFFLLFKIGIFQCVIKSLCKMCWAGLGTFCYALHDTTCCIWHKVMSVRHSNRRHKKMRRHFHDVERGGGDYNVDNTSRTRSSSSLSTSAGCGQFGGGVSVRKRKSYGRRRGGVASRKRKSFHRSSGHSISVRTSAKNISVAGAAAAAASRRLTSSKRRVQLMKGKKKPPGKNGVGSFKRRRLQ